MPRTTRQKSIEEPAPIPAGPDPHMHRGKCTICRHPQRAEIERAFVDWCSPTEIANMFGLASRSTIYRHARARGLHEIRRRNLHYGLARIAEQVADVKPSAANVIAAFIAMAKINARGEWDNGHRFSASETADHTWWEAISAAARENELDDTLEGQIPPIHAEQKNLRKKRDALMAAVATQAAEESAEAARESERQAEEERQAKEKTAAKPAEPKPPQKEKPKRKAYPQRQVQLAIDVPPDPPAPLVQEKKPTEPKDSRPQPVPQPPEIVTRHEDRGPYQPADTLPPHKKIFFARRRGRRPVVP